MAKRIFYMHGFPPAFTAAFDDEIVSDLIWVARTPTEKIQEIVSALRNADGFLDPAALRKTLQLVLTQTEESESAHRILLSLSLDSVDHFLESFDKWRQEPANSSKFDEISLAELRKKLPQLLQPIPSIVRFRKAVRLQDALGQQLEDLEIICDLRPIFDDKRENIEGLIPLTTLKVTVTNADGLSVTMEAVLTAQQVTELKEKAVKAETKLEALRRNVHTWIPGGLPALHSVIAKKDS
jgi:hypothetical protein